MKSFKQFLIEMASPQAAGSQQRNIVPPGSIPPPKMPPPTRLDPGSLPPGHDRPDDQEQLPPDIDWQALDDRMQDLLRLYEDLLRMMGILPWDQFVEYMRRVHGNMTLSDRSDFDDWFRAYSQGKLEDWFNERYPNATPEQIRTMIERIFGIYHDELWEIYRRYLYPPDDTDDETEEQAPPPNQFERDRERARERWEREHY
jgi:hypothetical protein